MSNVIVNPDDRVLVPIYDKHEVFSSSLYNRIEKKDYDLYHFVYLQLLDKKLESYLTGDVVHPLKKSYETIDILVKAPDFDKVNQVISSIKEQLGDDAVKFCGVSLDDSLTIFEIRKGKSAPIILKVSAESQNFFTAGGPD